MTVEAWSPTPEYTISGVGPYAITHPYTTDAIRARVRLATGLLTLNATEFSVTPTSSDTSGNLFLSPTAAAAHAGLKLVIDRVTPDEQGWVAVQGEREAGLAAQLDRMVQAAQELRAEVAGALRIRGVLDTFDLADGAVPVRDGNRIKSGPTATQIAEAQARATEAAASAQAAANSAAEALAKENSMLRDRGNWATSVLYSLSDIFTHEGSSYITQVPHIATTVAADLTAGRIRLFAARGAPGAGTGDVLAVNAGSEYTPAAASFRANIGLGALAVKNLAAFADLDAAAVRLSSEGVASLLDTELATTLWAQSLLRAQNINRATAVASTSGTEINFTDIPSWVRRITVALDGVSLSGTNSLLLQLGDAGGIETTGYSSGAAFGGGGADYNFSSTAFMLTAPANQLAADAKSGALTLINYSGNSWVLFGSLHSQGYQVGNFCSGSKTLSQTLDRIRIVPSGSNTFDAGLVNILWE